MTYDIQKYQASRKAVIQLAEEMTPEKAEVEMGRIAVATGVPLVVVGHMLGEHFGYSEVLMGRLMRLEAFYDVEAVVGKSTLIGSLIGSDKE